MTRYIISRILRQEAQWDYLMSRAVVEVKETTYSFLWFAVALVFLAWTRTSAETESSVIGDRRGSGS